MDKLSPAEHHVKGLECLAEAESLWRRYGAGSVSVPGLTSMAMAHFAASQSATMGAMMSDQAGATKPFAGSLEAMADEWGTVLGLFAPGDVTPDQAVGA